MRILYLSESYVPSRRASSVHVMRMCQAFSGLGHEVTLVTKGNRERTEPNVEDDFEFYGVGPDFSIRKFPRPSFVGGGIVYTAAVWWYLRKERRGIDVVYARDIPGAWAATRLGLPVIFEAHGIPSGVLSVGTYRQVISAGSFLHLVVISEGLRGDLESDRLLPPEEKVVVAHDAADPISPTNEHPNDSFQEDGKVRLGYVGHLYPGRGIEVLVEMAGRLNGFELHLIGGTKEDIAFWKGKSIPSNVFFHGFVKPGDLGSFFTNFDILLMPYQKKVSVATGKTDTARWMSPLKMFEYMATGKPIISSDLPVLREVLANEKNALLVPPNDVEAWQSAVLHLKADPNLAQRLGRQAQEDFIQNYTWTARAKKVLQGL